MIQGIEVNEKWYGSIYEDIGNAAKGGSVVSVKQHFVHDGYFAGRLPFPIRVVERWYLTQYPDVADSIGLAWWNLRRIILRETAIGKAACRLAFDLLGTGLRSSLWPAGSGCAAPSAQVWQGAKCPPSIAYKRGLRLNDA
jgi:hypothetical protein